MSIDFAVVFTRFGLILDFLAFWLAAPEILGRTRLLLIKDAIEKAIEGSSRIAFGITAAGLFLLAVITGSVYIISAISPLFLSNSLLISSVVIIIFTLTAPGFLVLLLPRLFTNVHIVVKVIIGFALVIILIVAVNMAIPLTTIFSERPYLVVASFASYLAIVLIFDRLRMLLSRKLAHILRYLSNDQEIRRRSLALGAGLFVFGFIFQLLATF